MAHFARHLLWIIIGFIGAGALSVMAFHRGEHISAAWLITAAVCFYAVGYRYYSRIIGQKVFALDDRRLTPAVRFNDGQDYVPTPKWVVFGHHFAAIAGAGPLVGPILAAQFGVLPGALWIIIGVVIGGAVQDFIILCASMRRDGKSLGQMARDEIGPFAGILSLIAIVGIIIILIAFLSLVVVNALAESSWATVTLLLTVPIAFLMGFWMHVFRPGKVLEASAIGLVLLAISLWIGKVVADHATLGPMFLLSKTTVSWGIIIYGFIAAVLPVWMLLAPRDYLSSFVKIGTIVGLALGILFVLPDLTMPMINPLVIGDGAWANGTGPVVTGQLFPFCFITIACGAISGFHSLVASGTTPKMIEKESHAPMIGYGGMLVESLVAILALIAACSLHPGIYFAMNTGAFASMKGDPAAVVSTINGWITSFTTPITVEMLTTTAEDIHEDSIIARAGGAPTLAVGMAYIFSQVLGGTSMIAFWYHFAILFEALFILTTVDAGTRVGRFLLQDLIGQVWAPARSNNVLIVCLASAFIVAGWGYFVLASVLDPNGGVRALLPLFGIANQLLAAVALAVGTVILLRMGKAKWTWLTLIPLVWLVTVTLSAGWIKITDPSPAIGFLAKANQLASQIAAGGVDDKALSVLRHLEFNQYLNAILCGFFMFVIVTMLILCGYKALRLLSGREPITVEKNVDDTVAKE
jgi:carbon starvation protein